MGDYDTHFPFGSSGTERIPVRGAIASKIVDGISVSLASILGTLPSDMEVNGY